MIQKNEINLLAIPLRKLSSVNPLAAYLTLSLCREFLNKIV